MTADRTPDGSRTPQTQLREYALFAPRLARLVWRLLRDPRVPSRSKATVLLLAGYLASPIDLVPDFVPGMGQVDDLLVAAFALDHILNRIPDDLVREHWDGDEDVLEIVRNVLDMASGLVPRWVGRLLNRG